MDTVQLIINLGVLIGALSTITAVLKKQISKDIRNLDYNNCKTYLTDFLADIKNNCPKSDTQRQRATEIYDHYIKDLKGNSYIKCEWEKYMK